MKDKTCMVFCPHQDDELNICGPLIKELNQRYRLFIVYMTNGNFGVRTDIRVREAGEALSCLGVERDSLIFMGYPDQLYDSNVHYWFGKMEEMDRTTEGNIFYQTWHASHYGEETQITRSNLISDITSIIIEYHPNVLICVDYDWHCDHRVLSMAFEEALGNILLQEKSYDPIVYKTYAYVTMYVGKRDFTIQNLPVSKYYSNEICNPFLSWDNRIQIPVHQNRLFLINDLFKAYSRHVSQLSIVHVLSAINSDHVFWLRRTDNLLKNHCITQGKDVEKLWDFRRFSTLEVMKKEPLTDAKWEDTCYYIIHPSSKVALSLDEKYSIESIQIFGRIMDAYGGTGYLTVYVGGQSFIYDLEHTKDRIICADFANIDSTSSEIIIENMTSTSVALTEVEVYEKKPIEIQHVFIQAYDSTDRTLFFDSNRIHLQIKCIERYGRINTLSLHDVEYKIQTSGHHFVGLLVVKDGCIIEIPGKCNHFCLMVWLKDNKQICWQADFYRVSLWSKAKEFFIRGINYITHSFIGEWCKKKKMKIMGEVVIEEIPFFEKAQREPINDFIYNRFDLFDSHSDTCVLNVKKGGEISYSITVGYFGQEAKLGIWLVELPDKVLSAVVDYIFKAHKEIHLITYKNAKIALGQAYAQNHFRIELPDTYDELQGRLSAKGRYNIRREKRILITSFDEVIYEHYTAHDKMALKMIDDYFRMKEVTHDAHYNMSASEYIRNFHVSDIYAIIINKRTCAVLISCEQCEIVYLENLTYDTELAKYSLGQILYDYFLMNLIEKGKKQLYLGGGDLEYKKRYGSVEDTVYMGSISRTYKVDHEIERIKGCLSKILHGSFRNNSIS